MKLNRIRLTHFRCFEHFEMDFAEKVTVLFGRNGVGKTSLIHAITKALSFIFYTDTARKDIDPLNAGNPKITVENFNKDNDGMVNPETGNVYRDLTIDAEGRCFGVPFKWSHGVSSSSYRYKPSLFKDAYRQFMDLVSQTHLYPVMAYYSDGFPHIEEKSVVSEKLASLRNFGYHQWNEETACCKIWLERFERTWKIMERNERMLRETNKAASDNLQHELEACRKEIKAIEKCLIEFSADDPDMTVEKLTLDAYNDKLAIVTSSGEKHSFRILPAGYKRLFYIILDLAYRSYILNGNTDARGVAIIDEIDLHLHPALEQTVLSRLTRTFPHTQFIVSTHSPLVLANLDTENGKSRIYRMNRIGTPPTPMYDIYGLDYNTSLEDVMGVGARQTDIDNLVGTCAYLQMMGEHEKAKGLKKALTDSFHLSEKEVEERVSKQANQMGDVIHR